MASEESYTVSFFSVNYLFRTLSQSISDSYQGFFFGFAMLDFFFYPIQTLCMCSCGN